MRKPFDHFRSYSESGNGKRRKYLHDPVEAAPYQQEPGTFTPWEDLPEGTDILFYEGLHGAVVTPEVDIARYPDLLIGVVPVINLEWIQKLYRDKNVRGYSAEAVTDTILRRMPDYVNTIVPQFAHTHVNFQRVPVVDTSNPFIARDIPTAEESVCVIRFANRAAAHGLGLTVEQTTSRTLWEVFPHEYAEKHMETIRRALEEEYAEQLDGVYDIQRSGEIALEPGAHLSARQRVVRSKVVSAIEYHRAAGLTASESVGRFIRDAAFTTLNRFVAIKMLEARQLVQPALSQAENSTGYREFIGLAPGVSTLGDGAGYRIFLESLFDELASEIKVLFDRRDAASLLWPRRKAFEAVLAALNDASLDAVWGDDETIGWFYQFFNSQAERDQMRKESPSAPRNSRELAVRNQFFTPRYVVQFLVDNTLGRTWIEMTEGNTALVDSCEYFVTLDDERPPRPLKDPRDLKVLDPACGSGHFLLYAFDLLVVMYREAWERGVGRDEATGLSLTETFATADDLAREAD